MSTTHSAGKPDSSFCHGLIPLLRIRPRTNSQPQKSSDAATCPLGKLSLLFCFVIWTNSGLGRGRSTILCITILTSALVQEMPTVMTASKCRCRFHKSSAVGMTIIFMRTAEPAMVLNTRTATCKDLGCFDACAPTRPGAQIAQTGRQRPSEGGGRARPSDATESGGQPSLAVLSCFLLLA